MASVLLRTSARRESAIRRFVSAAPSGGEGLAARPVSLRRCPLRRLSNSTTPGDQLPKGPDEKLDALLEEIRAKKATTLPNDVATGIFVSSLRAREDCYVKQLSRSWMTGSVLVSGGFIGYYYSNCKNGRDGAREGN